MSMQDGSKNSWFDYRKKFPMTVMDCSLHIFPSGNGNYTIRNTFISRESD
jgi:hypothetical protein